MVSALVLASEFSQLPALSSHSYGLVPGSLSWNKSFYLKLTLGMVFNKATQKYLERKTVRVSISYFLASIQIIYVAHEIRFD